MASSLFRGSSYEVEFIRPLASSGDESVVLASVPRVNEGRHQGNSMIQLILVSASRSFSGTMVIQVLPPSLKQLLLKIKQAQNTEPLLLTEIGNSMFQSCPSL